MAKSSPRFSSIVPPPGLARAQPSAPPPAPEDEGAEGEGSETCNATITEDQLNELQSAGSVTLKGDDGEQVVLTMDQSAAAGQPPAGASGAAAPEGMPA